MDQNPTPRLSVLLCTAVLLILAPACTGQAINEPDAARRPNVILLMADDMGWGSFDFPVPMGATADGTPVMYEGTRLWQTPNLRAMADNGLVFGRMYSQSSVCSPTRASVLTGRSPERIGVHFANVGRMENREVTIAEYAQALGYRTGMFGKWHLGVFTRDMRDANRGGRNNCHAEYSTPLLSGFDVQYATESKTSTYDPGVSGLTGPTHYWTGPGRFIPLDADELRGDDSALIIRETNAFIEQAVARDEPFLAVVWFHTPHKPLNTPGNEDVDNLAAYRFAMQDLDTAIGTLRDKLRELGVADDTVVFFTADNGPEDDQDYCEDPLRANKRELYEGGVRVPGLVEWPGRIAPGTTLTPMVTSDYLPTMLDIWGIDPLDDRPLDGTSLTHTFFTDRDASRGHAMTFKIRGLRSILSDDGRYKLISTNRGQSWALYDIVVDYTESEPLVTSDTLDAADAQTRTLYNDLLARYNAWDQSVQHSLSGSISGDYPTYITQIEGATLEPHLPPSLVQGAVQGDTPRLYLERQNAVIDLPVAIRFAPNPEHDAYNSYLLHFDPVTDNAQATVRLRFEDELVLTCSTTSGLNSSDRFSFADPAFDTGDARGIEAGDRVVVEDDGTVTVTLRANTGEIDEVRLLTRARLNSVVGNDR